MPKNDLYAQLFSLTAEKGWIGPDQSAPATFDDLFITDINKRAVSFTPNSVQLKYLDMILPDWQDDLTMRGLREIVLKARKEGLSTLIAALFFLDTINTPNTTTIVIAYDGPGTEKLFRMVKMMQERLPAEKCHKLGYDTRRQLTWPAINSRYEVLTAGTKASGRGDTINNLHCSETAFWEYPEVVTGLLQAVPRNGNIFIESTANGELSLFHDEYQRAKKGQSTFTSRFFSWADHDEYQTPTEPGFIPTSEEIELAAQYNLTFEQLQWRRDKIKEPGMGNMFPQEFPINDREAFLVSGSKFFPEFEGLDYHGLGQDGRHVCLPFDVPAHYKFFGGLDWGYAAPFCFLLFAADEAGNVLVIDEVYTPRLTNPQQADAVKRCITSHGLSPRDVLITADPSMWAKKQQSDGVAKADIEYFWAEGISCVPANNNRAHGFSNIRVYFAEPGKLKIFKGKCPNLIRTLPQAVHDKAHPEDMDDAADTPPGHFDSVSAFRYGLGQRVLVAKPRPSGQFIQAYLTQDDGEDIPIHAPKSLPFALSQIEETEYYE